jgi:hypothetical protein
MMLPASAFAQDVLNQACVDDMFRLMDREHRLYRSVLFGQKSAADSPDGSTRTDSDFHIWMKTGTNAWRSLAEGYEQTTWGDSLIDERGDVPIRRGLLEQRRTPTSDLLPPMLQSMRALQCRLRSICALGRVRSESDDAVSTVTVQAEGCLPMSFRPLKNCIPRDFTDIGFGTCAATVDSIVERESRLLHLLVTYDSAYRSVLQFGGGFEGFLSDVRLPFLQPLWQTVRILGSLDNLPCFLAQCDE